MNERLPTELSTEIVRQTTDLLDQSMLKIRHCLDQLEPKHIWWRPQRSMNSIGNLLLHLAGNLQQWGVVPFTLATDRRDRESEFQDDQRNAADELLRNLQAIVDQASEQWKHLTAAQLLRLVEIQGFGVTHLHAILHASSHFVGHTHQIIQLTRLQLGANYKFHWTPSVERDDLPI
jgi:hypothetical protein